MRRKSKHPTRAERLAAAEKAMTKTLHMTRVTVLKARGVKALPVRIPDYTVVVPNLAPLSQCKGGNGFKRSKTIAVPDGHHIGHSHKQGMMVFPNKEVEWSSGKKS